MFAREIQEPVRTEVPDSSWNGRKSHGQTRLFLGDADSHFIELVEENMTTLLVTNI